MLGDETGSSIYFDSSDHCLVMYTSRHNLAFEMRLLVGDLIPAMRWPRGAKAKVKRFAFCGDGNSFIEMLPLNEAILLSLRMTQYESAIVDANITIFIMMYNRYMLIFHVRGDLYVVTHLLLKEAVANIVPHPRYCPSPKHYFPLWKLSSKMRDGISIPGAGPVH